MCDTVLITRRIKTVLRERTRGRRYCSGDCIGLLVFYVIDSTGVLLRMFIDKCHRGVSYAIFS